MWMGGFDGGFGAFGAMFAIAFAIVICVFVALAVRGVRGWSRNNRSPRLTVEAAVVAKRMDVTHCAHSSATWYYVTFEVESGDRMELGVDGGEYGLLAEGDRGRLSFQGTRYLGFERD